MRKGPFSSQHSLRQSSSTFARTSGIFLLSDHQLAVLCLKNGQRHVWFQKTAISPYFIIFHLFLIHLPTFHFQVGLPTKKTRKSQFWMTFHRLARKDSNRIGSVWVFQMIPPNGRFIRRTAYFHLFSESLRQENPPFL